MVLRRLQSDEWKDVAHLIHRSTNAWYEKNHSRIAFPGPPDSCLVFPEVYEAMDPGCCIIAVDEETGTLAGSCFFHPRETHYSLGIMNSNPDFAGQGVARSILAEIIRLAEEENKPVRLVSSAMNLDSFSLYTRAGFVPRVLFQDMQVPDLAKMKASPPDDIARVRDGRPGDAAALADLENELVHIRREKDYRTFLENEAGIWHVSVYENEQGVIEGFLAAIKSGGSNMLGPGVMRTDGVAAALVHHQLCGFHAEGCPLFLVPVEAKALVEALYQWGARNRELHVCQVRGECPPISGIVMPTFMPETG